MSKLTLDDTIDTYVPCYCKLVAGFSWKEGTPCECQNSKVKKIAKQQILQAINRAEPKKRIVRYNGEYTADGWFKYGRKTGYNDAITKFKQNLLKELGLEDNSMQAASLEERVEEILDFEGSHIDSVEGYEDIKQAILKLIEEEVRKSKVEELETHRRNYVVSGQYRGSFYKYPVELLDERLEELSKEEEKV